MPRPLCERTPTPMLCTWWVAHHHQVCSAASGGKCKHGSSELKTDYYNSGRLLTHYAVMLRTKSLVKIWREKIVIFYSSVIYISNFRQRLPFLVPDFPLPLFCNHQESSVFSILLRYYKNRITVTSTCLMRLHKVCFLDQLAFLPYIPRSNCDALLHFKISWTEINVSSRIQTVSGKELCSHPILVLFREKGLFLQRSATRVENKTGRLVQHRSHKWTGLLSKDALQLTPVVHNWAKAHF